MPCGKIYRERKLIGGVIMPFKNIRDWKDQFQKEWSKQRRIGMLHSLFSPDEFKEKLDYVSLDEDNIAAALLWAAKRVDLEKELTTKVVQMLATLIFRSSYCIAGSNEQLIPTLQLLRQVRHKDSDFFSDDSSLSKIIYDFLSRVVDNYKPLENQKKSEVIRTVCDMHYVALLTHEKWLGDIEVITELKSRLGDRAIPFSSKVKNSKVQDIARNLAIHFGASALMDSFIRS